MKKLALLVVCASLSVSSAWSQMLVPMTPGAYLRGKAVQSIGQLAMAIGALARQNRELEEEIVNARREFFEKANTPQGPDAATRFEEALHRRDLHYVVYDIASDRQAGALMKFTVQMAGSQSVDGGISPYCFDSFRNWSHELVSQVSALGELQPALQKAMPQFEKYRVERDLAEALFFNPGSVLRAASPNSQEYLAAWLLGTKVEATPAAANQAAGRLAAQLGSARFGEIVDVLRDWTNVAASLEGPWGTTPRAVLDPLVAGGASQSYPADWAPQTRVFLELRGRLLDPRLKLAGALDEMQGLWNSGRQSHDVATLRRAAQQRDALAAEIEAASLKNLELRNGDAQLAKSMTGVNFLFIDKGISALEIDAMIRGEKNPRHEQIAQQTREYLAVNAKLTPRSVEAPPQAVAQNDASVASPAQSARGTRRGAPGQSAPALAQTVAPASASVASGPVLPEPGAEGTGPLDRAIVLAQQPKAIFINPSYLSNELNTYAKKWDLGLGEKDADTRTYVLGSVVEEMQLLVRNLRQEMDNISRTISVNGGFQNNPQALEQNQGRKAALKVVADEVDGRIVDMQKTIAAR